MSSRFIMPFADVGSGIKPSSGAQLFFFEDDGVTPKDTFSDQLSTPTPNTNPVISDSNGVFSDIYIVGSYKVTLKDKNGSQIFGLAVVNQVSDSSDVNSLSFIYNTNFDNFTDLKSGTNSNGVVMDMTTIVGAVVFCRGYITKNDGGHNWGIVKSGPHTDDGGRVISIDTNTYVEMNMTGIINIRKWGCDPSIADNSIQWQKAQTYAESNTGGGTLVPAGIFNCLSPIEIGFNGFVQGVGYSSRPTWVGVNAFNFAASGIPSSRGPIRDLWVIGDKTAGTIAFNVDTGDEGASLAIKGLLFDNVTVDGFEEAWHLEGSWNCELRKCETINCWWPANQIGKNVHTVYSACNFVRGSTTLGTGTATGVRQYVSAGGLRSEDIQIKDTLIFGFDYATDITNCLVCHQSGNDYDFCVQRAARVVNIEGSGSITGTWMWLIDAIPAAKGVDFVDTGTDTETKFVISGNSVVRQSSAGVIAGSDGVFVGTNHRGTEVKDNIIKNWHSASKVTSPRTKIRNNKDTGITSASVNISEFAERCLVEGNDFSAIVNRHPTPHVIFGNNNGVTTQEVFTVTLPSGLTSITTTWAALGLPDAPANSSFSVSVNNTTTTNLGWLRGRAATTSVTVDSELAPGANTLIDVTVTVF